MLEATLQTLGSKFPRAGFTLLSHYPAEDARLNHHRNLNIAKATPFYLGLVVNPAALLYRLVPPLRPRLRRIPAIGAIAKSAAVLDEGGITFSDGRELYLLYNVASILPALLMGVPVIKCAQAVGPFKNPLNRLAAKIFLPRMALIVARGEYTEKNLSGLRLKNVVRGADYAFALEVEPSAAAVAKQLINESVFDGNKTIVGVSPSVVIKKRFDRQGKDYVAMMAQFIDWLAGEGYAVALIPHSVRSGTGTHNNDLPLCREIYDSLSSKAACFFLDREVPDQPLRYIIGQCDLFVASRFHAMVSSLSMGVPSMVIGWSHKYAEVLKQFGVEDLAMGHHEASLEALQKLFNKLAADQEKARQNIKQALPEVTKLSRAHADLIGQVISGNAVP